MSLAELVKRVESRRIGLGVKMYAAFGLGVLLMLAASVVADGHYGNLAIMGTCLPQPPA